VQYLVGTLRGSEIGIKDVAKRTVEIAVLVGGLCHAETFVGEMYMVQPTSLETITAIGKEVIETRGWDTILKLTVFSITKGVFSLDKIYSIVCIKREVSEPH
jgi:hypothetical protein